MWLAGPAEALRAQRPDQALSVNPPQQQASCTRPTGFTPVAGRTEGLPSRAGFASRKTVPGRFCSLVSNIAWPADVTLSPVLKLAAVQFLLSGICSSLWPMTLWVHLPVHVTSHSSRGHHSLAPSPIAGSLGFEGPPSRKALKAKQSRHALL